MESMVDFESLFGGAYLNKKVVVTGHSGFKGSWLSLWLKKIGAKVFGISERIPTQPSHFEKLELHEEFSPLDIRDRDNVISKIKEINPEIIFHLAAQPLVRKSYYAPHETFETNTIGLVNVYDAALQSNSVKVIVNITSDKCYENNEWEYGYREIDPLGGKDPYSASKACSEIITKSYRESFFKEKKILLASGRAGNVIGGGDWSEDRIVVDIVKSITKQKPVEIRNPNSIRPWQHVLEPLSGYLRLGQLLLEGKDEFANGWNFGPITSEVMTVEELCKEFQTHWKKLEVKYEPSNFREANLLKLDCSKSLMKMNWFPIWSEKTSIKRTALWYKSFYEDQQISTEADLEEYVDLAMEKKAVWASA